MPTTRLVYVGTDTPAGYDAYYSSPATALAGEQADLDALDRVLRIECGAGVYDRIDVAGYTMDETHRIEIVAAPSAPLAATWATTGVVTIQSTTNYKSAVSVAQQVTASLYLEGLQLSQEAASQSTGMGVVDAYSGATSTYVRIEVARCRLRLRGAATGYVVALNKPSATGALRITDCTLDRPDSTASTARIVYVNSTASGFAIELLSNTLIGGACELLTTGAGSFRGENNLIQLTAPAPAQTWAQVYGTGGITTSHTLSNSAGSAHAGTGDILGATITFTDAASGDYRPVAGSANVDAGADLSADGITTDLLGTARPQGAAWDIGALEYVVTPAPETLAASGTSLATGQAQLTVSKPLTSRGVLQVQGAASLGTRKPLQARGLVSVVGGAQLGGGTLLRAAKAVVVAGVAELAVGKPLVARGGVQLFTSVELHVPKSLAAAQAATLSGTASLFSAAGLDARGVVQLAGHADLLVSVPTRAMGSYAGINHGLVQRGLTRGLLFASR